jgi:hypothetical protein
MQVGNPSKILTPEQKIDLHKAFWLKKSLPKPLVTFHLAEDFFFSRHYKAAEHLLEPGKKITPDMLDVDLFMDDYENMFQDMIEIPQDGFWAAQPFTGIPWMEAILGCDVIATGSSFVSEPFLQSHSDIERLTLDDENAWFLKYIKFLEKLEKVSDGRFPIGQPIMRGPSDMIGSVMGQTEMVFAFMEDPEGMRRVAENVTAIYLKVIECQFSALSDFYGGYSMGFYHLWCPGKCIWFQEDLSAILSPTIYRNGLKSCAEKICRDYDFTSVHLHPSSFFILDELMSVERLRVIEINKDVDGPTIEDMVPIFEKVLSSKNLMIWGELDETDLECIVNKLPPEGIFLNIIAPDAARACELVEVMNR